MSFCFEDQCYVLCSLGLSWSSLVTGRCSLSCGDNTIVLFLLPLMKFLRFYIKKNIQATPKNMLSTSLTFTGTKNGKPSFTSHAHTRWRDIMCLSMFFLADNDLCGYPIGGDKFITPPEVPKLYNMAFHIIKIPLGTHHVFPFTFYRYRITYTERDVRKSILHTSK